MDLTPYLAALREDLSTTASAGDESTRRAAALLSAALEPAARLAIMNALADLAAEVTASLDGQVVEVRLDGRDVSVVVTGAPSHVEPDEPEIDQDPPMSAPTGDSGDVSRMTLRLFEELKGKAEQAAAAQGVSLNTYVTQAVQGALRGKGGKGGPWGGKGPWNWADEQRKRGGEPGSGGGSRVRGWTEG
ncbi:HicB-like protein involved in pilus formation [Herbihabitans rhizosphaerae]|uniref:HicB-like protein involved in pilus formation n=1 Tax=Herbihabitans rhizosphaerae TaxID=1872711 RepID=A0A4Q7KHJ0_9PSEU|nr:toxin-antitoxin system HicB family antitoxin [Herbihabitans rhizosphaerae]RZS34742.1 HicB-like protein involved in pilus formation [Herbihabitans rhizosphaerae]